MTVLNDTYPDPTYSYIQYWEDLSAQGINGRGLKRPGRTTTVGGRTVTSGADVTNDVDTPTKPT